MLTVPPEGLKRPLFSRVGSGLSGLRFKMACNINQVEVLYQVFKPYRLGDHFVGCSHCVSAEWSRKLAETPLAALGVEDLDLYAFKAMTTWGEVDDFKHFLPRIFELALIEPEGFNFYEVLFGKLAYGNWHDWPSQERAA